MTAGPDAVADRLGALPPLRARLEALGLLADKRLGQHFLFDLNLCRKIVRLAGDIDGATVLEIGPGPGGLTQALVEAGARVIAIEKDSRFLPALDQIAALCDGALSVIEADALKIDEVALIADLGSGAAIHIVANLPYNVGTALLLKWLLGPLRPASMTLMFQKEVADRIVAPTGSADYGRLSVIAQTLCEARTVMDVPARAFTPPPKVDSAVVRLVPRAHRPVEPLLDALQKVTQAAFGQRRKMLRSSLAKVGGEGLCLAAGVDPSARAETISPEGFLALAEKRVQPQSGRDALASSDSRPTRRSRPSRDAG